MDIGNQLPYRIERPALAASRGLASERVQGAALHEKNLAEDTNDKEYKDKHKQLSPAVDVLLAAPKVDDSNKATRSTDDEQFVSDGIAKGSGTQSPFIEIAPLRLPVINPPQIQQKAIDLYTMTALLSTAGGEGDLIGVDTYA